MVGTLHAQIEMIWPLEQPLLERLGVPNMEQVADLGCGTAQFAGRVAERWPHVQVSGIDLFEGHVKLGRAAYPAERVPNLNLVVGDARHCPWTSMAFDLVAMRHFLHAVPEPQELIREARRLLKPGGVFYVLAEDYQTLIFDTDTYDAAQMFNQVHPTVLKTGTDLQHGRTAFRALCQAGFEDVRVDPIVVDTVNTPRDLFARMLRFWRDGYTRFIATGLQVEGGQIRARFDELILTVLDTERYASWTLFAVSGRRPRI